MQGAHANTHPYTQHRSLPPSLSLSLHSYLVSILSHARALATGKEFPTPLTRSFLRTTARCSTWDAAEVG